MKYLYTLLALFTFFQFSDINAQVIKFIQANNIRARVEANGDLFNDGINGIADFEVPLNSNSFAIYYASFCVSGTTSSGNLRASGAAYTSSDYATGPLTLGTASSTATSRSFYDKIWEVSSSEISYHKANFNNPSYTAPFGITNWPAHGDTTAGFDYYLAPFVDVNSNGTYEPTLGDYPAVKGQENLYFIFNDASSHNQTGGSSMGLEIHCMVHGSATNNAVNETVYTEFKVINRSNTNYSNVRFGKFIDFDLGNYNDDFIETDVNRSMVFAKNGDNFDESVIGTNGYGNLHAAIGMVTLKGPKLDSDLLDNICNSTNNNYHPNGTGFDDGIIDNERFGMSNCIAIYDNGTSTGGSDFDTDLTLNQFMSSKWKNGRPQTFGGNGFSASGGVNSRFPFFSNTDSTTFSTAGTTTANNWTENTANNIGGDRKVIVSSGPFSLNAGDEQEVAYAYVFARANTSNSVANSVSQLKSNVDFIINEYRTSNSLTQCQPNFTSQQELTSPNLNFSVFPNPIHNQASIITPSACYYSLRGSTGKLIEQGEFKVGSNTLLFDENLSSGIYFLTVFNGKKLYHTEKISLSR